MKKRSNVACVLAAMAIVGMSANAAEKTMRILRSATTTNDTWVAEIGGLSYEESCERLFEALEIIAASTPPGAEKQSAVQYVLARLGGGKH